MHYVLKGFIEHGINPILLSFLRSLIFLLLPFCLSTFASSSLGLSFDPRSLDPHLLPSHPALPCRFGSSRHRCNASCRARACTSEKPVSKPGILRRDRRSLVTWVTLFLFLSRCRRFGISAAATAAAAKGSATKMVARRRPWHLSPMNRSRVATCVCARVSSTSPPFPSLLLGSRPLSLALSMSVSRSAGRRTGRGAPSPPPLLHRTQRRRLLLRAFDIARRIDVHVYDERKREREKGIE